MNKKTTNTDLSVMMPIREVIQQFKDLKIYTNQKELIEMYQISFNQKPVTTAKVYSCMYRGNLTLKNYYFTWEEVNELKNNFFNLLMILHSRG